MKTRVIVALGMIMLMTGCRQPMVEVNGCFMPRDEAIRRGLVAAPLSEKERQEQLKRRQELSRLGQIDVGDVLSVMVDEDPSLKGDYDVRPDGTVRILYLEPIPVHGMTDSEATGRIRDSALHFLKEATVRVEHRTDSRKNPPGGSSTNDAGPDFLRTRVCADVNGFDPVGLIEWMCKDHVRAEFDEATLARRNIPIECGFGDIEAKYIIAWGLHLLNASGSFQGKHFHVRAVDAQCQTPTNDVFACYLETKGPWATNLTAKLAAPCELPSWSTNSPPGNLVLYVLCRSHVGNYLIAPSVLENPAKVSLKAGVRPCSEILDEVCRQAGLQFRIQGGLVYVTKDIESFLKGYNSNRLPVN